MQKLKDKMLICWLAFWLIAGGFLFTETVKAAETLPRILQDLSAARSRLIEAKTDFLEANLAEMKFLIYKAGQVAEVLPLYKRGDPADWGDTPFWLYYIQTKAGTVFSWAADVWMPYSLKFYGKYYIHGEPYYTGGQKYINDLSGGCVELQDKDAARVFRAAFMGEPLLIIDQENDNYQYGSASKPLSGLSAKSYIIADVGNSAVLAEKNSQEQRPIYNLTSLITAAVITENTNLKKIITINSSLLVNPYELSAVKLARKFSVVNLFYPLLAESSWNAGEALSRLWGKQQTTAWMNEKAKTIGMAQTRFMDLAGIDAGNISTAQDLFYLARYIARTRPILLQISQRQKVRTLGTMPFSLVSLTQQNIFPKAKEFLGGKTSFSEGGRYSEVLFFSLKTATGQERRLVFIILDSADLKSDTVKAYSWLERTYFPVVGNLTAQASR